MQLSNTRQELSSVRGQDTSASFQSTCNRGDRLASQTVLPKNCLAKQLAGLPRRISLVSCSLSNERLTSGLLHPDGYPRRGGSQALRQFPGEQAVAPLCEAQSPRHSAKESAVRLRPDGISTLDGAPTPIWSAS